MTLLRLRLNHAYIDTALPAAATAKVRWLAKPDGSAPKKWWSHDQPIVAGSRGFTEIKLPGGGYFAVDVVRPRGAIIGIEVSVAEGETHDEPIELGASPHEYLSWQQFAGVVPRKLEDEQDRKARIGARRGREGQVPPPLLAAYFPDQRLDWDAAAHLSTRIAELTHPYLIRHRQDDDGRYVTWFLEGLSSASLNDLKAWVTHDQTRGRPPRDAPRWALVSVDRTVDLVSIPWAWWIVATQTQDIPPEPIRILHDRLPATEAGQARGRTSISIRDEKWFALLEFLASGRLVEAGSIAEEVINYSELVDALERKKKGPLLAVAAAIILLARTRTARKQPWDPWLDNLATWFPAIPDGKVLVGCRRLQQATSRTAVAAAFGHLKEGFERGVPFFSEAIRMLSLALAQLSGDLEEAEQLRRKVVAVGSMVDPDQPFTVLRLLGRGS